ncbi:MAG: hypothetical protein ACJ749_16840, partial [Flavisolibacter sp.]
MSFNYNDNNNKIHLGNYEEFFILYMDNELSPEQMNMVDDFLTSHPDLRGEFESLMGVKLPAEEFTINKQELFSNSMVSSSIKEELLLYIDNELDADKKRIVEFELASNNDYHLQHELLRKTKLDPTETITHPNKEELYRRTERVVAFKIWMRVAAAVIILAAMGIFYFTRSSTNGSINGTVAIVQPKTEPKQNQSTEQPGIQKLPVDDLAAKNSINKKEKKTRSADRKIHEDLKKGLQKENAVEHQTDDIAKVPNTAVERKTDLIETPPVKPDLIVSLAPSHNEIVNNSNVTTPVVGTYKEESGPNETAETRTANNDKKGSVKGFLR